MINQKCPSCGEWDVFSGEVCDGCEPAFKRALKQSTKPATKPQQKHAKTSVRKAVAS